jgi:hypothetical protein
MLFAQRSISSVAQFVRVLDEVSAERPRWYRGMAIESGRCFLRSLAAHRTCYWSRA